MKKSVYTVGSLLILLIAAFVFVFVPVLAGKDPSAKIPPFGSYNGKEIKINDSRYSTYLRQFGDQLKQQGQYSQYSAEQVYYQAFTAVVRDLYLEDKVTKSGYVVPNTKIARAMRPYFMDQNGNFSEATYRNANKNQVAELQKNISYDLLKQRYIEDLFGNTTPFGKSSLFGIKSSSKQEEFFNNINKTNKEFNMVSFNMNDYPNEEKIAFGKNNQDKFVSYDLSIITCSDKTKATSLANRIKNDQITFDDASSQSDKNYSNPSDVKLRLKYAYRINEILSNKDDFEKIQKLQLNEVSEPIQTNIGYSIFRLDAPSTNPDFTKTEVVEEVYNYLKTKESSHIENYYIETAKAFTTVAKNTSFDSACRKYNVKKTVVSELPVNYRNVSVLNKVNTSIDGLSGADYNENLLKTVASLKTNEYSEPILNNSYFLVFQSLKDKANEDLADAEQINAELSYYNTIAFSSTIFNDSKFKNNFSNAMNTLTN